MKYAVVTGSTSGIGLSIAKALIAKGYYVFVNGRENNKVDLSCDMHEYVQADVSCKEGVDNLIQVILERTPEIDCLVLNAGGTCKKTITDMSFEEWQFVMDINLNMPFYVVKKLLPNIKKGGNILFISSALAMKAHATSIAYGVSKAGLNALAQNLVKEVAGDGIRVNSICPGFVDTDWQKSKPQWLREKIVSKIALKRFAKADEIADMCVNVIENTYMNGAIVSVDGGYDME